jgi:Na+-translocating ferredoxin:NAD+ oxidoreductase RnfC subunit
MPDRYPGGAGKLITARLLGRMPGAGMLNTDLGFLISNVASCGRLAVGFWRAVGRGASVDVDAPGMPSRRLIVPIGVSAAYVLNQCGVSRIWKIRCSRQKAE